MAKLILLGGPPGIGKTTVLTHLPRVFESCACLDADDVWRVQPDRFDDPRRRFAVENVIAVLRGYLQAGVPLVFLGWVLANPQLVARILDELEGCYESSLSIYLVASREALQSRSREKFERGLLPEYQLLKLQQIEALSSQKIDTTDLEPAAVARAIGALLRSLESG